MRNGEPVKDLLLFLSADGLVFEQKVKEGRLSENEQYIDRVRSIEGTFGSSREASTPGLRFLRSLKTPSSNFFMFLTGRPKALGGV